MMDLYCWFLYLKMMNVKCLVIIYGRLCILDESKVLILTRDQTEWMPFACSRTELIAQSHSSQRGRISILRSFQRMINKSLYVWILKKTRQTWRFPAIGRFGAKLNVQIIACTKLIIHCAHCVCFVCSDQAPTSTCVEYNKKINDFLSNYTTIINEGKQLLCSMIKWERNHVAYLVFIYSLWKPMSK